MIELSEQQRQELAKDEPVRICDPLTNETYVILRAQVYERLQERLYDDSPRTDEEMDLLAAEDADSLGWEGMEDYQEPEV